MDHREPNKQDLEDLRHDPTEWEEDRQDLSEWDYADEEYDRRRDEMMDERLREREA